ncbi:MAG: carbon starvation protein A [Kiritimatiellae bacterium]|nr:carbon starvation protein A [Kiritimatiellia bacterium]
MNGTILLLGGTAIFFLAYFLYGRFIEHLLGLDPARPTPARTMGDGIDYVPAHPAVLFGHHFASIAGAGPIVGPIAAAYFGWGPVVAWVILGCIFIGAVHDMASLFLSVRHQGRSIASVIETVLGRPGKLLFLLFCWSTLVLVCAEFTRQVAATFVGSPEVATASLLFIALAVVFGLVTNRAHVSLLVASLVAVPVMFACIWVGSLIPLDLVKAFGMTPQAAQSVWTLVLIAYCFLASTLPVWLLLQPRDYLNSYLLYAMMALGFLGVIVATPDLALDRFVGWQAPNAKGLAQPLFPILFITIACGACSGFHSLVASGTTAKQIADERHIRPVAYGGMLLEGILALLALLAVASFTQQDLLAHLGQKTAVQLFAGGLATFCTKFGLPQQAGYTFMCLAVSAFLMTSVDTATRLGRFTWQELFVRRGPDTGPAPDPRPARNSTTPLPHPSLLVRAVSNMYVSTALVVGLVALLLLGDPEAAKNLWNVFASANQLMAALTLLTVSLWMLKHHKAWWVTFFPMAFMLAVSAYGLYLLCTGAWSNGNSLLGVVTAILLALAAVLLLLAIVRFLQARRHRGLPAA